MSPVTWAIVAEFRSTLEQDAGLLRARTCQVDDAVVVKKSVVPPATEKGPLLAAVAFRLHR